MEKDDAELKEDKKRTQAQNRAMHLFFEVLAEQLNENGLDMKKVLKPEIDISWTKYNVKEYIWKPIQEALYLKKSTTELLKTEEIDKIYDVVNRHISEKFGISVQFPSEEDLLNYERHNNKDNQKT